MAAGADGLGGIEGGASVTVYSAGFSNEWISYVVGVRLISDGLDLRGRFALAQRAALSFTCFAISNDLHFFFSVLCFGYGFVCEFMPDYSCRLLPIEVASAPTKNWIVVFCFQVRLKQFQIKTDKMEAIN